MLNGTTIKIIDLARIHTMLFYQPLTNIQLILTEGQLKGRHTILGTGINLSSGNLHQPFSRLETSITTTVMQGCAF
jgi:hypothetical protein